MVHLSVPNANYSFGAGSQISYVAADGDCVGVRVEGRIFPYTKPKFTPEVYSDPNCTKVILPHIGTYHSEPYDTISLTAEAYVKASTRYSSIKVELEIDGVMREVDEVLIHGVAKFSNIPEIKESTLSSKETQLTCTATGFPLTKVEMSYKDGKINELSYHSIEPHHIWAYDQIWSYRDGSCESYFDDWFIMFQFQTVYDPSNYNKNIWSITADRIVSGNEFNIRHEVTLEVIVNKTGQYRCSAESYGKMKFSPVYQFSKMVFFMGVGGH
eukprot:sb/3468185/